MALDGSFVALSVVKNNGGVMFRLDTMITCPLNESHIIPSHHLQSHLERCLIGDLIKMTCPWNPLHVVDETSYEYHLPITNFSATDYIYRIKFEDNALCSSILRNSFGIFLLTGSTVAEKSRIGKDYTEPWRARYLW